MTKSLSNSMPRTFLFTQEIKQSCRSRKLDWSYPVHASTPDSNLALPTMTTAFTRFSTTTCSISMKKAKKSYILNLILSSFKMRKKNLGLNKTTTRRLYRNTSFTKRSVIRMTRFLKTLLICLQAHSQWAWSRFIQKTESMLWWRKWALGLTRP